MFKNKPNPTFENKPNLTFENKPNLTFENKPNLDQDVGGLGRGRSIRIPRLQGFDNFAIHVAIKKVSLTANQWKADLITLSLRLTTFQRV